MKTKLTILALCAFASVLMPSCASGPGSSTASTSGVKSYPSKLCLVTDNDLDSMGDQQVHVFNGQQVKFCCEACWDKFQTNPPKYLAKLPKA